MKTTEELYRTDASNWKYHPYWKALLIRANYASEAMEYYRNKSREQIHNPCLCTEYENLYLASEDARDFNRRLADELSGTNNEQGDEIKNHD